MKIRSFATLALAALIAMVATAAQPQSLLAHGVAGQGEYIVGQQVLSGAVGEGGIIMDGGSYIGDLSAADAGLVGYGGAGCVGRSYGRPDLFYNFYTPGNCNRANAQLYMSPLPVPPNVGHTFFTYQPFYPHEMMYSHKNRFHNYYDNGRGMNRTRAVYFSPPIRQAASNFYWNYLRLPR